MSARSTSPGIIWLTTAGPLQDLTGFVMPISRAPRPGTYAVAFAIVSAPEIIVVATSGSCGSPRARAEASVL